MVYRFEILAAFPDINHFVSTRNGGVSIGEKAGLNLSFKVGDAPENVVENRKILAQSLGLNPENLVFPEQTHSSNVQVVTCLDDIEKLANTDAVITNIPEVCVCVMSADCVPILLYDTHQKVVSAIHAGWRGTVAGIVTKTIQLMAQEFGTQSEHLVACIGPSISQEVYEVGQEVIDAVHNLFGSTEGFIQMKENGKGMFNLWEANKQLLLRAGVLEKHIEVAGICTYKNSDMFFSHRHSSATGRFAAGICIKK